jgi:hypothetical protein
VHWSDFHSQIIRMMNSSIDLFATFIIHACVTLGVHIRYLCSLFQLLILKRCKPILFRERATSFIYKKIHNNNSMNKNHNNNFLIIFNLFLSIKNSTSNVISCWTFIKKMEHKHRTTCHIKFDTFSISNWYLLCK